MTSSTKLYEKLDGADNFRAWKYSLEGQDLDRFVEGEVTEPEDEVTRAKAKKGLGKSKGDDEACRHTLVQGTLWYASILKRYTICLCIFRNLGFPEYIEH